MKKSIFVICLVSLAVSLPLAARAIFNRTSTVASDQIVSDNFVSFSDQVAIEGRVKGDVIAAGSLVTIDGIIEGDLLVAASSVLVKGQVKGSIRGVAGDLIIQGPVTRNVTVLADQLTLTKTGSIGQSLVYAGNTINLAGSISGNVTGRSVSLQLSGEVKGNVSVGVFSKNLEFGPTASIKGNLFYESSQPVAVKSEQVGGRIEYREATELKTDLRQYFQKTTWFFRIIGFIGLMLIGLIIVSFLPRASQHVVEDLEKRTFVKLGWGIAFFLGLPVLEVILIASVVGIPLAGILLVIYGVALCLGQIFTSLWLGQKLLSLVYKNKTLQPVVPLMLGLVLFTLLTWIPYLGGIILLGGLLLGLSGIVRGLIHHIRQTNISESFATNKK